MPDGTLKMWPASGGPNSRPVPRPANVPTPCGECPKVPKSKPPRKEFAVELSERNRRCYAHYRECEAVNWQTPDAADPLVRHHAAIIRAVEAEVEAERRAALPTAVVNGLLQLGLRKR